MDTALDDDRQALRSVARDLFARAAGERAARELAWSDEGFSYDLWHQMAELEWTGLLVAPEHGGAGGALLDAYAVHLEMGRALVASPYIPSAVISAHVLASAGPPRSELLHEIAGGAAIVVPAMVEEHGGLWPEDMALRIEIGDDGCGLDGTKVLVPYAQAARSLLVVGRTGAGVRDIALVLVDVDAPGVSLTRLDDLAGLPLFAVVFDDVRVAVDALVGKRTDGWELLRPALDRAAVLRAAEIAGAAERVLQLTVDYALQREQFGRPIGQYQAVQYLCTDIAMLGHVTSLLARRAAWAIDTGAPSERAVAVAKSYASSAAHMLHHAAHEVFAGVAFMDEHDLHLFTRRAKHWEQDLGDEAHFNHRLGDLLAASTPSIPVPGHDPGSRQGLGGRRPSVDKF